MSNDRKRKRAHVQHPAEGKKLKREAALSADEVAESSSYEVFDEIQDDEENESSTTSVGNDDEQWGGFGHDSVAETSASRSKGTVPKKPPTGEELRTIKDAAELYMSSSFKLQVDALLPKVKPRYTRFAPLDKFLLDLHSFLAALPSTPPHHPLSASSTLLERGVAVPYLNPPPTEDTNWKVAFDKPQEVSLLGTWNTKLAVKRKDGLPYVVDVAVEMPNNLFQEKDYLNNRFFNKRAYYLSVIAAALASPAPSGQSSKKGKRRDEQVRQEKAFNIDIHWETMNADPRLTALILQHKPDGSASDFSGLNVQVRLIATLSSTSPMSLSRLSPHRSNFRIGQPAASEDVESSTPVYNSIVLLHAAARTRLLRMYNLQKNVPAFGDALALVRVWANQRGYGESGCNDDDETESVATPKWSVRGFHGLGFWWVSLLDYLINGGEILGGRKEKRKPLGHKLSSYQLFRAALDFLSKHNWTRDHVFLRPDDEGPRFPTHEFQGNNEHAVFVDTTSGINILAGVPMSSLEMLGHDATVTLETLSNNASILSDPFDEVFLQDQRNLQSRFDVVLRVDLTNAKLSSPSTHFILEQGSPYNALLATISSTLRAGLSNRVKSLAILHSSAQIRNLDNPNIANEPIIYVGLVLDTEHSYRLVDFGPPAAADDATNDAHADTRKAFRALWGPKSELRRFKDGRILESVVWEVSTVDERAHIPFYICKYLLQRHCGIGGSGGAVHWAGPKWDELLKVNGSIAQMYQTARVEIGFKAAMVAFDGLVKQLKGVEDELPLAILNISPVSPLLRYTNTFIPVAIPPASPLAASTSTTPLPPCARYVPLMDIIIEFEKSGRWPDDLKAIQKVKMAFLEAIAASLGSKVKGLTAKIVLEEGDAESINDTVRLEIFTPEGWAFSARICHDREATLLDDVIDDKPHVPQAIKKRLQQDASPQEIRARHIAAKAKEIYVRRYIHGPRHHRAVAALSHQHSAYAGTVRLVKRWLASHWLLEGHIQEEVIELLCALIFMRTRNKEPQSGEVRSIPATKERGFALVVQLLAQWRWEQGIDIPLYGNEPEEDASLPTLPRSTLESRRGAWIVRTEKDPEGRMWTADGPDAVVARRVQDIAKATWNTMQANDGSDYDVKTLFMHPTTHYDFLIQIDPSKAPCYLQNLAADEKIWRQKGGYANAIVSQGDAIPLMPGFDPLRMLYVDIMRTYEDTLKLFHNPYGGTTFGAVFDPTVVVPRPFRVHSGYNSIPADKGEGKAKTKDQAYVALNVEAILAEVTRTGAGLVNQIILQS